MLAQTRSRRGRNGRHVFEFRHGKSGAHLSLKAPCPFPTSPHAPSSIPSFPPSCCVLAWSSSGRSRQPVCEKSYLPPHSTIQAPTARSSSASTVRAERAYTSKPPTVITTASAVLAHESAAEEHSPLSSPTSSGKLSDRYRRPSVAPKHAVTSDAEFGTVGSRRPTPTGIRVPTVRRRAPVDGASAAEVSTGAENTAPTGSDGKFARQIPRARTGGSSLAEFGTSSSVSAAAGLAGGGGGVQFGGANSLLGKMRGPIGGRNSPLLNSPLRAASPRIAAGGGEDGGQGIPNSIPFAVPTPPRAEAARPGSGVRRAPIRPVNMPLVSPASCSGGDE
jgi:hypothetical protein